MRTFALVASLLAFGCDSGRNSPSRVLNRVAGTCAGNAAEDLARDVPELDPKVERCEGPDRDALCFVSWLQKGARVTASTRWDCSTRQERVYVMKRAADLIAQTDRR